MDYMKEKHHDQNMVEKFLNDKNEKSFIVTLINHFLRDGKKNWSYKLINETGLFLSFYLNKNIYSFYEDIFIKARPFIEIRKVRVRRTIYYIPFPTSVKRQQHLVAKWIFESLKMDKRKMPTENKFREELLNIFLNKGYVIEKKKENYIKAEKSRSFSHYRWY